jgi:hypothetical protein
MKRGEGRESERDERHPAYGMIGLYRVHGGPRPLYGSSILHQEVVRLAIARGRCRRELGRDWYFREAASLIEVELSLTQFAELITSPGHGSGFPCTLVRVGGEAQGEPPVVGKRAEFTEEFAAKARAVAAGFAEVVAAATALRDAPSATKAARAELVGKLGRLQAEIGSNMPYLADCFQEQVEKTVKEAKGEVEAFFARKVTEAGLEALVARGELRAPSLAGGDGPDIPMIEAEAE